jgi:RNA polymerase sigma-B factor
MRAHADGLHLEEEATAVSRTDPQALLRDYRATRDPRAREAIVTRFLPLARSLARRFRTGAEPLEDLEQVAALALVKAVDAYDPDRGSAFSSYAVPCIAGAIKRHFRDCGWSVRVPRELQERAMNVQQLESHLQASAGESPTVDELAAAAGLTAEEVLEAREAYSALHASSLDMSAHDGDSDEVRVLDTLGASDEHYAEALDRTALDSLLGGLEDRDRAIVVLYFREELTQAQIGERLGYSQMHISRLLRRAVGELERAAA